MQTRRPLVVPAKHVADLSGGRAGIGLIAVMAFCLTVVAVPPASATHAATTAFTTGTDITTTANGAFSVTAADLDGDGDIDLASASALDDTIAWYENDGTGGFTTQPDIATTADGALSVTAADLDGDGDIDLASASVNDDTIAWRHRPRLRQQRR